MNKKLKQDIELSLINSELQGFLNELGYEYIKDNPKDRFTLLEYLGLEQEEMCHVLSDKVDRLLSKMIYIYDGEELIAYIENVGLITFDCFDINIFPDEISIFEVILFSYRYDRKKFKDIKKRFKSFGIKMSRKKEIAKKIESFKKTINNNEISFFANEENISDFCKYGRTLNISKKEINKSDYNAWEFPRVGDNNPTKVKSKVWEYGVSSRLNAYSLCKEFKKYTYDDRVARWSFDRLGKSVTFLADGREIHIAGEHEDHYDPDFYIYNDVTVVNIDGSIDFYLYPKNVFIPTDFHTATLVDDKIIIIGNLSYGRYRKEGYTQVYELDIKRFRIEKKETTGEMPGWIHSHKSKLSSDNSIIIENGLIDNGKSFFETNVDKWELDLETYRWKRLTKKIKKQIFFQRKDGGFNNLFDIHLVVLYDKDDAKELQKLKNKLGHMPDLELYEELYNFSFDNCNVANRDDYNNIIVTVDNATIDIKESLREVNLLIIGDINPSYIEMIKKELKEKLEKLEQCEYIIQEL